MTDQSKPIDITTLPTPTLSTLQTRLTTELEHLSTSHARLRSAQLKFQDCLTCLSSSSLKSASTPILVPLTTSLYVPARSTKADTVLVDVGTGYFVSKSDAEARKYYEGRVGEVGENMRRIEGVVKGKSGDLRVVEEVLRERVLSEQAEAQSRSRKDGGEEEKG